MSFNSSIAIVGTGNVATFLAKTMHKHGLPLIAICGRNIETTRQLGDQLNVAAINNLDELVSLKPEIVIIAVNDDAIERVSQQLQTTCLVIHTSGNTAMSVLMNDHARTGVFYPLQSIQRKDELEASTVPVMIEASNQSDLEALLHLAEELGMPAQKMNSQERQIAHLAAVFVNNFGNHLATIAMDLLKHNHLSKDILKPLISQTAKKLQSNLPADSQTGPAKRGDQKTMLHHLELLKDHPNWQHIYRIFSEDIGQRNNQD